ncbi:hypothetical protein LCGC14_1454750 [marine sediment metagenome]|uniref:Uncharacterized protein n=1 Tax=marine sediment metagenome TaxID=412755 RepID=A0A0F9LXE4_9ZZZZ
MIGKILAYFSGLITGLIIGIIFSSRVFDYIFKFIPLN